MTPPFKPKVKSAQDVANFDKTFVEQSPVDSFVHSKIAKTEKGSYVFKDFEYSRWTAEKNEISRYEERMRSLTLNDSLYSSFKLM